TGLAQRQNQAARCWWEASTIGILRTDGKWRICGATRGPPGHTIIARGEMGGGGCNHYARIMNYLAHGWRFTAEPYFLAGTATPDWLNVIARKVRLRSRVAAEFVNDSDPLLAAVARGIVQHHADDAWFHATTAFNELNLAFAVEIRDALPGDEGFRPS